MIDFETADFEEILKAIDEKYLECKGVCGRLDERWGKFSTDMNRILRKRRNELNKDDPDTDRYLWIFAYWICRSKLLDLHMKNRIVVQGRIKRLKKEIKDYRRFVITGKNIPSISEKQLLEKLLKRK